MSISSHYSLLEVIGVVATILFGLSTIYLYFRRSKYPASLTFIHEQSVALLDDFATKLPNLTVSYKEDPINKSVVLVSGYLTNDGNLDITKDMVENPLVCRLPGACTWLEFKITTIAESLDAETTLLPPSEVQIKFGGLFRRDESFAFQALALADEDSAKKGLSMFGKQLHWSHRIANLDKIKTTAMLQPDTRKMSTRIRETLLFIVMALSCGGSGLSMLTGLGPFTSIPSIDYQYTKNGKTSIVMLYVNTDGTTTVKNIETGEEQKVNLAEFSTSASFLPVKTEYSLLSTSWAGRLFAVILMVVGLMGFVAFCKDIIDSYKRYRMRKLLAALREED